MRRRTNLLALLRWRAELVRSLTGDILEIGVGKGENLGHYRAAQHLWAIEPDERRAMAAVRSGLVGGVPIAVQIARAEHLPYADQRFDHVVSSLVFCSVLDPSCALAEIDRVLRPDGILHMVEHVRPQNARLAGLSSAVTPWWRRMAYNCHLDRATLDLLQGAGWRVQIQDQFGVFVRLHATRPSKSSSA